jgi:hypothetical protein
MKLVVRPPGADCPELDEARWAAFAGEDRASRLVTRALLSAYAASTTNRYSIASAWEGDALLGVAAGVVETHERGREVLVIAIPGAHQRNHCPGLWLTDGVVDGEAVTGALVDALRREARVGRSVIAFCPLGDDVTRAAALRLGGRELPAPPDHHIIVDGATTFEAWAATLPRKRAWKLRQDLARAGEVGATVRVEDSPSSATLETVWPLCAATLARKGSRLLVGEVNLLAAIAARVPLTVTLCERDGATLGALVAARADSSVQYLFLAHVDGPPLHVSSALWASSIRAELDRGTRALLLGYTGEVQKQRMGARPVELVQYYLLD